MPRNPVTPSQPLHTPKAADVISVRLRQAREHAGLSQEALATGAGIDELSASARMSQYETGKHTPRYETMCRFADVLNVPVAFFYASDDSTAHMLLLWHSASTADRQQALTLLSPQKT